MKSNRDVLYTLMDNIFENLSPSRSEVFFIQVPSHLKQGNNYGAIWSRLIIEALAAAKFDYFTDDPAVSGILDSLITIHETLARGDTADVAAMLERTQPLVEVLSANKDDQIGLSTVTLFNAALYSILVVIKDEIRFIDMAMNQYFAFYRARKKIDGTVPTDNEVVEDFYSSLADFLHLAIVKTNASQPLMAVKASDVLVGTDQDAAFGIADETDIPGNVVSDVQFSPIAQGLGLPPMSGMQSHSKMPAGLERALVELGVDTSKVVGIALITEKNEPPLIGSQELAN